MANPLARFAVRAVAAAASRQIASRVSGSHLGPIGNVAAVALPFVLRRVSPLGLAAMAVGAWGLGKLAQSMPAEAAPEPQPAAPHAPLVTPPPIAWAPPSDAF
jgi:hypothetical protein